MRSRSTLGLTGETAMWDAHARGSMQDGGGVSHSAIQPQGRHQSKMAPNLLLDRWRGDDQGGRVGSGLEKSPNILGPMNNTSPARRLF